MAATFDATRFVEAQDPVIDRVKRELTNGRKQTHWMWFVFPQVAGLGRSEMARRYAIGSLADAEAYLHHAVLGPRLIECTNLVNTVQGTTAHEIFGSPDNMKFHSCMTLFARVLSAAPQFRAALDKYFDGAPDRATLRILEGSAS